MEWIVAYVASGLVFGAGFWRRYSLSHDIHLGEFIGISLVFLIVGPMTLLFLASEWGYHRNPTPTVVFKKRG